MLDATMRALDWEVLRDALAQQARTRRGAAAARALTLHTQAGAVREAYAEVEEVLESWRRADDVPVGGVADVEDAVTRAARGMVLDPEDLRAIGITARVLEALRSWADARADWLPRLYAVAASVQVDPELVEVLSYAFDAAGALDARTYPELGILRRRIEQLRERIRSTLEEIVRGQDWGEALQDRFVSERDGRFVVPVKMGARRGLGIVHGVSGSGETAFVEPTAVVELHNELKETEGALARAERRILAELSRDVGRRAPALVAALAAATRLDLAVARAALGRKLDGSTPTVGLEGVVALARARHPVLVLQGVPVVGNDLRLSPTQPGLVLTGPNAGGKTVALKTLGVCALMVRAAIPIPADPGSRCDLFDPILADVGDQQSVSEGLSTFSAHVGLLKAALGASRHGALVLLDEVAVGTDPAQGAALARAVLEAVVARGARVVATTHYPELKTLADADARFVVAAAQVEGGRPTYRLEMGEAGASYALTMAARLGLDPDVLARAHTLLDEGQRALADTLERLHAARAELSETRARLATDLREVEARSATLARAEAKLAAEGRRAMEADVAAHRERLRRETEQVRGIVARLQAGADLRSANRTLEELRTLSASQAAPPPPPIPVDFAPVAGDAVRLRALGTVGRVVAVHGERVEIEAGRMRMRVARTELEPVNAPPLRPAPPPPPTPPPPAEAAHVRTRANSCDLRGMRVEDALTHAEAFLNAASLGAERIVFLCHGHGTGALKQAVRAWLPSVRCVQRWRAADATEGGDGWTVVEMRG